MMERFGGAVSVYMKMLGQGDGVAFICTHSLG